MKAWGSERDFVGYGGTPPHPRWPGGARIALNIVINYEEGSELSFADGDGVTETGLTEGGGGFAGRDLAAESMYEFGARVGFWRVLRILSERNAPATIFGCALALERNPPPARPSARPASTFARTDGAGFVTRSSASRRSGSTSAERSSRSRAPSASVRSAGIAAMARARTRDGSWSRKAGSSTTSDAYNDELPYWLAVDGRPHLVVPYSLATNDGKYVRGAAQTGDDLFLFLRDHFDFFIARAQSAEDDVGRHPPAAHRPCGARRLARTLSRSCPVPTRCLALQTDRHRATLDRASPPDLSVEVARTLRRATLEDADKTILALALDHRLVTRLTSLVAVDKTPSRPEGARLTRADLPLKLPAGVGGRESVRRQETRDERAPRMDRAGTSRIQVASRGRPAKCRPRARASRPDRSRASAQRRAQQDLRENRLGLDPRSNRRVSAPALPVTCSRWPRHWRVRLASFRPRMGWRGWAGASSQRRGMARRCRSGTKQFRF